MPKPRRTYYLYVPIILLSLGLSLVIKPQSPLAATVQSGWFSPENPQINPIQPVVAAGLAPVYSNKPCIADTQFVTIPRSLLSGRVEASYQTCAVRTNFGLQSASDSRVVLNDTNIAGTVTTHEGGRLILNPIPNSDTISYLSANGSGSYISIIKDFKNNIEPVRQFDGSLQLRLKQTATAATVHDYSGNAIDFTSTRFSDNGQWFIGDVPYLGMTRVNITSGEALTFGPPLSYTNGQTPKYVMAISADGRYAVVAESSYEILRIYDLAACTPNPDPAQPASCPSRDVLPHIRRDVPGFKSVYAMRFSTDFTVQLFINYANSANISVMGQFLLSAPGKADAFMDYLALGDSFASGEGAWNYKAYSDVESPFNKCHLSRVSYPFLLAGKANVNSSQSVACSGALMKDIIYAAGDEAYRTAEPQAEGKAAGSYDQSIYADFLVGYRTQGSFVARNKPNILTVSVVGNDIGFGKLILSCIKPGTCLNSPQDKANLAHTIDSKSQSLTALYNQLKDSAASTARIYAIGYPQLVAPGGNCANNVRLNNDELIFANQLVTYVNSVIKVAASKAGVEYIDTEKAFAGHRLCETKSSDIAVNGLTAGNDKTATIPLKFSDRKIDLYLTGRESYHPNQLGHRLLADTIYGATNGFSLGSGPQQSAALARTDTAFSSSLTQDVPPQTDTRKIIVSETLSSDFILFKQPSAVFASALLPLSDVTIGLHGSAPLEKIQTSAAGEISTSIAPADSSLIGLQWLEVTGKNVAGEDVILQKLVYIAAGEQDIDGDGILNNAENCLAGDAAAQDDDEDGIADACDAFIDNPPLHVAPSLQTNPPLHVAAGSLGTPNASAGPPAGLHVTTAADSVSDDSPKVLGEREVSPINSKASVPATFADIQSDGTKSSPLYKKRTKAAAAFGIVTLLVIAAYGWWRQRREGVTIDR